MSLVRVEIQRAPRRMWPERWAVVHWRQDDEETAPAVDAVYYERSAKEARTRARQDRKEIWSPSLFRCGCGAVGRYEEMFDDSGLETGCGGNGFLNCFCGGDFCVCHNHGEMECPGCEDCELDPDQDDASEPYEGYDEDEYEPGDHADEVAEDEA